MICPSCGCDNIAGADQCQQCHNDLQDLDLPQGESRIEQGVMKDPIGGLIPPDPLKVSPDTPIREVIKLLLDRGRHCALVVDNGAMVGILTERDVLLKVAQDYERCADQEVSQFMTRDPERLRPSDPVAFGLNRMMVGDYRHVPIEKDGEALGVVSVRHILAYLNDSYPEAIHS